jgi:sortase A
MARSVYISFLLMGLGFGILVWVLWPIASFHLLVSPVLSTVVSPLSTQTDTTRHIISDVVYAEGTSDTPLDYTNANVWFPKKPQKKVVQAVNAYTLKINKLGIQSAMVIIAGDDLNTSVIHYGGTALPGQIGNGVLFGHSILPQFFDPKNYKSIFSTLPKLEVGDTISITYDGIEYTYIVQEMNVTSPNDLTMLDQPQDDSYITLVTCVPPGTYWQRLHVLAKLSKI